MALCPFCSTAFGVASALFEYIPLDSVPLVIPSHPLASSLRCDLHSDEVNKLELNVWVEKAPQNCCLVRLVHRVWGLLMLVQVNILGCRVFLVRHLSSSQIFLKERHLDYYERNCK